MPLIIVFSFRWYYAYFFHYFRFRLLPFSYFHHWQSFLTFIDFHYAWFLLSSAFFSFAIIITTPYFRFDFLTFSSSPLRRDYFDYSLLFFIRCWLRYYYYLIFLSFTLFMLFFSHYYIIDYIDFHYYHLFSFAIIDITLYFLSFISILMPHYWYCRSHYFLLFSFLSFSSSSFALFHYFIFFFRFFHLIMIAFIFYIIIFIILPCWYCYYACLFIKSCWYFSAAPPPSLLILIFHCSRHQMLMLPLYRFDFSLG